MVWYNRDMRKTYIVGNWKMNLAAGEASVYLHKLSREIKAYRDVAVVVAPSLVTLQPLSLQIDRRKMKLAAQNFYHQDFGAFTGEVSISQLRGLVDFALVGHSERRHIFGETDKDIRQKVAAAIRNGVRPILCIGETANERTFGETAAVIKDQLLGGLSEVSEEDIEKVMIAYEPVWAISSTNGAVAAGVEEVAEVLGMIRGEIATLYGAKVAEEMVVMFGGSVNENNAGGYLTIPGCDGLLVGGASLKLGQFVSIIDTAKRVKS